MPMISAWGVFKKQGEEYAWLYYAGVPLFQLYPSEYKMVQEYGQDALYGRLVYNGYLVYGGRFKKCKDNCLEVTEWPIKLEYKIPSPTFVRDCLLDVLGNCKDEWHFSGQFDHRILFSSAPSNEPPYGKLIFRFKSRDDAFQIKLRQ